MIKDNEKNFSRLQMIIDANCTGTVICSGMADPFCWSYGCNSSQNALTFEQYMLALVFIVPVYLLLYQAFTLYTPMRMQGRRLVLANIVKANLLGLLLMFTFYMIDESDFSRSTYIFLCNQYCASVVCPNVDFSLLLRDMREKGAESETDDLCGIQPRSRRIH